MDQKKKGTLRKLLAYLFSHYRTHLIVVAVCIVISSCASVIATIFLQKLIDECITPGIKIGRAHV